MKKILWKLLEWCDNNWGYSTPLQKRFESGQLCKISDHKRPTTKFEVGEVVFIVETGRHDYLIRNGMGEQAIVYQYELI